VSFARLRYLIVGISLVTLIGARIEIAEALGLMDDDERFHSIAVVAAMAVSAAGMMLLVQQAVVFDQALRTEQASTERLREREQQLSVCCQR
jgi:hypothetical protein